MGEWTGPELWAALVLFRAPILAGAIAGAVLGWFGVLVVLRRMVFVSAALTQSAGLGVAMTFWAQILLDAPVPPVVGALLVSVGAAGLLSLPAEKLRISREALLAVVWIASGAGALLVGDRIAQEAHDIASILFGSAVLVRPSDLWLVAGVALGAGLLSRKALVFSGYDPQAARVQGVPVRWVDLGLLVLFTGVVAVSTRALGALPVFAFSVLPGLAALLDAPTLRVAFPLALVGGALSGGLGYIAAFVLDLPVGASQAGVATLLVLVALPVRWMRSG